MSAAGHSGDLLLDPPPVRPAEGVRLPLSWNQARAALLKHRVAELGADGVLLSDPQNIVYFTGLWAISTERPLHALFTVDGDAPYWLFPHIDVDLVQTWWSGGGEEYFDFPHVDGQFPNAGRAQDGPAVDLWAWALRAVARRSRRVVVDRELTAAQRATARRVLGYEPEVIASVCLGMRMRKTPEELALISRSYRLFDEVHVLARDLILAEGARLTDFDLRQALIEFATKRVVPDLGLDGTPHTGVGVAIDLHWVRAGVSLGYPHAPQFRYSPITADRGLQVSGVIQLGGYGGECYRPYLFQQRTPHMERIWRGARDACLVEQDALRAGATCGEVAERILRSQIDAGLQAHIYHRPGHGQGPERHQAPWLSLGDDTVLEPGMCFSVEPGLYDPAIGFSANFSDTFVVQESGPALQMSSVPWTEDWCWVEI